MKRRDVYLLGITSMINDASSEGVYTLLPLLLKDPFLVGVVGGIFNGLAYMIKPLSGYLSDRWGRAKPLIAFGYVISSLARTLIAFLPKLLVPLAVIVDRIGKGIRDAPRDALLSLFPRRGWAFGLHRALDTTGAIIGVLLATTLISVLSLDTREAILYLGLLGFLALLPLLFIEEPRRHRINKNLRESIRESREELGFTFWITVMVGL
ncbi:MAG: MFS transporter, partial [Candidatus Diapherotrites archaeon]|nr:MFS transporter [Candidatus Diapherotrites archaeon]